MSNGFSGPVAQIVDNYLARLDKGLRGFPSKDREELVKEIHSHIYESFRSDPTENEVERILKVLDKLGEPADVISTRMPSSMVTMGRKKKLPFYILSGFLIAFFGVPLGLGGLGVAVGLTLAILSLILSFYIVAFSLIISGWLGALVAIIRIFSPGFLEPWVQYYPLVSDPSLNAIFYIIGCFVIAGLGFGMLWLGSRMMRGVRFVFRLLIGKIKNYRGKAPVPAPVSS